MIKNIIFDYGGVLTNETRIDEIKKYTDDKKQQKRLLKIFNDEYNKKWDLGLISAQEYIDYVTKDFNKEDKSLAQKILTTYPSVREMNPDMINLIKKLKINGHRIYILSDNNLIMYNYFIKSNLATLVDGYVISATIHYVKPQKEMYEYLFNKYDINPEESLFIDDDKINVDGGLKLKMTGYIYDDYNNLIKYLHQNKIKY
jgi:putative hydrolase of the HAD superfamily